MIKLFIFKKVESTGDYISLKRYKKIFRSRIRKGNSNMTFITSGKLNLRRAIKKMRVLSSKESFASRPNLIKNEINNNNENGE